MVKKAIIKPIVQALEEMIEKEDATNVAKKATIKRIAHKQVKEILTLQIICFCEFRVISIVTMVTRLDARH